MSESEHALWSVPLSVNVREPFVLTGVCAPTATSGMENHDARQLPADGATVKCKLPIRGEPCDDVIDTGILTAGPPGYRAERLLVTLTVTVCGEWPAFAAVAFDPLPLPA
jgi:hypothetical protein